MIAFFVMKLTPKIYKQGQIFLNQFQSQQLNLSDSALLSAQQNYLKYSYSKTTSNLSTTSYRKSYKTQHLDHEKVNHNLHKHFLTDLPFSVIA